MKFQIDSAATYAHSWAALDGEGEVVAVSPIAYTSEKECRTAIAHARRTFVGAKFAKVVSA